MTKLACFILLLLMASSLEVDAHSGDGVCIGLGKKCVYGTDKCCGDAICQPEYACVRAPCPAPWICRAQTSSTKHFVLVHGGGHGAWCWYKVKTLLEEAGHKVTAFDLAAQGRNLKPLNELHTIDDYQEPLYLFMAALSAKDRIILVGHSYGGYAVSSAMERFSSKISLAVFVTAFMVGPDLGADQLQRKIFSRAGPDFYKDSEVTVDDKGHLDIFSGPKFMAHKMYNLSPSEDYTLAKLLIRTFRVFNDTMSMLQLLVSKEKYGSVPRAFFIALEDRIFPKEIQYWLVQNNPPNEVRKIIGADHMVMFSKPLEFCSNLLEVAMKY